MAITRTDETELLTALHDGMHETPPWRTFADRLRRRTRADGVAMALRRQDAHRGGAPGTSILAAIAPDRLRPGRVYDTGELADPGDPGDPGDPRAATREGDGHGRIMRVVEAGGTSLLTMLSRARTDFGAGDGALLAALAPHLAIALRNLAILEGERLRRGIAQDALGRVGIGWAALDGDARIIDAAPPRADGDSRTTIAVPPPRRPAAATAAPATILLSREPRPSGDGQAAALARLFQLTPSEARLALLLADGLTLARSAARLGLTVETARNYSKRIFSKTGTGGQAQLVRLILTGVAVLA